MVQHKTWTKKSIEEYTARCIQYQSELEDTTNAINTSKLVRKRRQGLGHQMNHINSTIDDLCVDLPQWLDALPMYHLMDQAIQYLAKVSNGPISTKKSNKNIDNKNQQYYNTIHTNTNNNNNNNKDRNNNQDNNNKDHAKRDNLPQGFFNLDNWKSYIKKVVGTHSFIRD